MASKDKVENKKDKKYFKEIKSELKKVTWPTSKELVSNTSAVIVIVIVIAIIVFALDVCFEKINDLGVTGVQKIISTVNTTEEDTETSDDGSEELQSINLDEDNVEIVDDVEESTPSETTTEEVVVSE